jgi:hypothetical protein
MKTFAPEANNFTARIEAGRDFVVTKPFGGHQDHFGALHLKMR